MHARRLKLRHHGSCEVCRRPLAKGVEVVCASGTKATCLACATRADGPVGLAAGRWPLGLGRRTVITESGVWLVDARRFMGLISAGEGGGWFRAEPRLYVGGRDRTALVDGLARRVHRVRLAVDSGPDAGVPVHGALCFVDADFRLVSEPFDLGGVTVTWVRALNDELRRPGPVDADQRVRVHAQLAQAFPSAAVSMPAADEAVAPVEPVVEAPELVRFVA